MNVRAPKVIIHNSISLEGSVAGFEVDLKLHYQLAGGYCAGAHLVGSNTIKAGIELFGAEIPPEEESDFIKPQNESNSAYWAIPDTRGILRGILHYLRRSDLCRDVIMLISEATPQVYKDYLEKRNYDYMVCGKEKVNLRLALETIVASYGIDTIMVDAGPTLTGILLASGLVDEINLVVAPYLIGVKSTSLFSKLILEKNIGLELLQCREVEKDTVLLSYRVKKDSI
jgi:2,5-diamino-6-(ribosylamino)-4(3H)-pyrimidinone 5'-phosphate reductase